MSLGQQVERRRQALTTLSTVGAAVAGAGIGALLSHALLPVAALLLVVGIVSHLLGMVGSRQLLASTGYRTARWQTIAYWSCWAAIGLLIPVLAWQFAR